MWTRLVYVSAVVAFLVADGPLRAAGADDGQAGQSEISCPIVRGPVTSNIFLRVFPIRVGTSRGTAFTLEIENRQYIVTAKHVFEGELPETVEIRLDDWMSIPATLVGQGGGQDDVLILATDRQLSAAFPVDVGTKGLMLGQSVRFLGYIQTVRTSPLPGHKKRGAPLVLSGIVSGFDFRGGGGEGTSLWIDGHNNKGLSGGPVVYQPASAPSREECRWKLAGVISAYVPPPVEERPLLGGQTAKVAIGNVGLLRAVSVETVRELVLGNPIGFQLDQ